MLKREKSVIKKIAAANLKAEQAKNYFAGTIIALSAFLLTVVLSFGYNWFANLKNESDFQAIFYNISDDQVRRLDATEEIQKFGLYREVGRAKKEEKVLSILYSDEAMMDLSHAAIIEGEFPALHNEIAIEKDYIPGDRYTPGIGIGDRIVVEFRNSASKEIQTNEFVVSGILRTTASGEPDRTGFNALVSKAFMDADPYLSKVNPSAAIRIQNAGGYSNTALKLKITGIGKGIGISEKDIQINHINVDSNNLSGNSVLTIFCIVLVVLSACWLVIYNIFYISITKRIKQYGQLRALGATKKQIKMLVLYEGRHLSKKYVPIGIVLGCLASWLLNPSHWVMLSSLFLASISGLFTVLTVRVSLNAPAKFAAKTSPVEAFRYVGVEIDDKKDRKSLKRLTPITLAALNMTRSRKKTVLTISSLVFSGILFITFATLMNSADAVSRAKQHFTGNGDFMVNISHDLLSETVTLSDLQSENQLSDAFKKSILSIPGVDYVIEHQYVEATVKGARETAEPVVVGIENIPNAMDLPNGSGLFLNSASSAFDFYDIHYEVGDRITLLLGNEQKKVEHEFEVIGDIPDKDNGTPFYLPTNVLQSKAPFNPNESYEVILAENADERLVKSGLQQLMQQKDTLEIQSFSETVETYRTAFKTVSMAANSFMIFIALFSVMNLINTFTATMASRKVELGMMQAVGMNRKQLTAMLGYEAGLVMFVSFAVSLLIGNVLGYWLSDSLGNMGGLSYIQYQFPWSAILLYVLVMLLIQIGMMSYVKISSLKHTVVERLRMI